MKLQNSTFTNRKQYTKSAVLELKPYGRTMETICQEGILSKDKAWSDRARDSVQYIDKYIVTHADNALKDFANYDYEALYQAWQNKDKDRFQEYKAFVQSLESDVTNAILKHMNKKDGKFIYSAQFLFDELPQWLDDNGYEGSEELRTLKGTMPLYKQLCTSRIVAVQSKIAQRVTENMERFFGNIKTFSDALSRDLPFVQNHMDELRKYSSPNGYAGCMTREGYETYNRFISGINEEDRGVIELGFNGFTIQENNRIKTENLTDWNIRKAKPLHKQILTPKEKMFQIARISDNEELVAVLRKDIEELSTVIPELTESFKNLPGDAIVSGKYLHVISHMVYGVYNAIPNLLEEHGMKPSDQLKSEYTLKDISGYVDKDITKAISANALQKISVLKGKIAQIAQSDILTCQNIRQEQNYINMIIEFTSAGKACRDILALFTGNEENEFSDACSLYMDVFYVNYKATNLLRNYIIQSLKKESVKMPVLFNMPAKMSASWWNGKNKFSKSENTIVKMDEKYYFFTLTAKTGPVDFGSFMNMETDTYVYGCNKAQKAMMQVPRIAFSSAVKKFFEREEGSTYVLKNKMKEPVVVTRKQYDVYSKGLFKTDTVKKHGITEEEFRSNLVSIITLYKKVVLNYTEWSDFNFTGLKEPGEYTNVGDFMADVDTHTISMKWFPVNRDMIENLVDSGLAYMFLITNRTMYSEGSKKTSFAEVFLSIFSDENMADTRVVLNAAPQIFFRPAIIEPMVAHPKGSELVNKIDKEGNYVPGDVYEQLYHYFNNRLTKEELTADAAAYIDKVDHHPARTDIVKDARYSRDMFMLNYSYTLGKQIDKDTTVGLNENINDALTSDCNILTVVRSWENLLYYVLTDKDGSVLKEKSLNKIGHIDYAAKLKMISKQRKEEKSQNWKYDSKVANIKEAYISHAIHEIVSVAIENNALIIIDKVSDAARDKYLNIDNQLYGKFQDSLREKLSNYHVPGTSPMEAGGILNPLQLSYDTKRNQKGILVAVNDTFTSSVDPQTGFINVFDLSNLNSAKKQKAFLKKFDSITVTEEKIVFEFDYENFDTKISLPLQKWTLTMSGERTLWQKVFKKNLYIKDVAKYFMEMALQNGDLVEGCMDGNAIEGLSKDTVTLLIELLKNHLYGSVSACKEVSCSYRFSPVTSKVIGKHDAIHANMLKDKFLYLLTLNSVEESSNAWIAHFQCKPQS